MSEEKKNDKNERVQEDPMIEKIREGEKILREHREGRKAIISV